MEKGSAHTRLYALDGIRGIAILFVFMTHIKSTFLQPLFPPFIARIFFSSGVTGVSLLFILSGFFMALMYPEPTDRLAFIQKRYTRIFPLFTMMCLLTMIVRGSGLPWYGALAFGVLSASLFHTVWVRIIQRHVGPSGKRCLFLSFLGLQVLVGSIYFFWIMRRPAFVFTQQWPPLARETMIGLVNGTLTLPLGDYIPMIDGVYWSLAAEVLFYVLYVVVCVPLIRRLRGIPRNYKLLLLVLLIPFFGGLHLLATRLFALSLLQPAFGYYFVMGIVLGYLYRNKQDIFTRVHLRFSGVAALFPVLFFCACLFFKDQSFQYVSRSADPWLHMLWALPLTVAIGLALDPETLLSRILRSRMFVFLGTISYSMYLSHALVIHLVSATLVSTNVLTSLTALAMSFGLTILASVFLYRMLEQPYFHRTPQTIHTNMVVSSFFRSPRLIVSVSAILLVCAVIFAYQSNFNFFSQSIPVSSFEMVTPSSLQDGKVDMTTSPIVRFRFVSPADHFGVLTLKLLHVSGQGKAPVKQRLNFALKEVGNTDWYATNSYALEEIGDASGDPYGFPLISNAKNKTYEVELALTESTSPNSAMLDLSTVRGVHTVSKKELLRNPFRLVSYSIDRLQNVFTQADAKKVLWYTIPTLLFVAIALSRDDRP